VLRVIIIVIELLDVRCAVVTYVNDESARTAVDATATDAIHLHDRSQLCLSLCLSASTVDCLSLCHSVLLLFLQHVLCQCHTFGCYCVQSVCMCVCVCTELCTFVHTDDTISHQQQQTQTVTSLNYSSSNTRFLSLSDLCLSACLSVTLVCLHVCVCLSVSVFLYVSVCVCFYVCVFVCFCLSVCMCVCVCLCVCLFVCLCVSVYVSVYVCQVQSPAVDNHTSDVSDDVTADVNKLNDDVIIHMFTFLSLRDRIRCERGLYIYLMYRCVC